MKHSFKTHSYCRVCVVWKPKEFLVCDQCGKKISHKPRNAKVKDQNRWLKAY